MMMMIIERTRIIDSLNIWKLIYPYLDHTNQLFLVLVAALCASKNVIKLTNYLSIVFIVSMIVSYRVSTNDWYRVTWIILAMIVISNCHIAHMFTFNILLAFLTLTEPTTKKYFSNRRLYKGHETRLDGVTL